jgi:membrane protein
MKYSKLLAVLALAGLRAQVTNLKSQSQTPQSHLARGRRRQPTGVLARHGVSWTILRDAASGWMAHKASTLGAAIAYYSLFSIGPVIVIVIAIAGLVFGDEAVRGQVSLQLSNLLGEQGAKGVEGMLSAAGKPAEGLFATALSVATLIFAAIGVVVQLKDALNTVWEVKSAAGSGIWGFVRTYAISLAGVLSLGFLLLVSLLLTTAISAIGQMLAGSMPELLLQIASFIVSFAITSFIFAMMFKWLPDVETGWQQVLPGSVLTAALFEIGKFLIGFYIGKQGLESTYGAAASLVVVLIWVYYSAQIVLFGAEFTRAYHQKLHFGDQRSRRRGEILEH